MNMNEQHREQISVLTDDEHTEQPDMTLNLLSRNEEHRQLWMRYHLIGESLRGNLPDKIDTSIADRVREALRDEPVVLAPSQNKIRAFLKPAAGFAIAATVAVVAVLSVQQTGKGPVTESVAPVTIARHQPEYTNPDLARTVTIQSSEVENQPSTVMKRFDTDSRFSRYLMNHSEYRTNTGMQGMLPYVRIVAVEPEQKEQNSE